MVLVLTVSMNRVVKSKQLSLLLFHNIYECPLFSLRRWGKDDLPSCFGADCPGGPTSGAASTCSCCSGPQQGAEPLQRAAHAAHVAAAALLR